MNEQMLAALVVLVAAAPLLVIGFYFRSGRALHLLAGVDPKKVRDPAGLGRFVGQSLILLGLLHVPFAGVVAFLPEGQILVATLGLVVLVGLVVVRLVFGLSRFVSK
ncbi:DUF3784 domain-containing protein [Silanimonas sp.]|jgi:hypothetical protein|uniref:DUF3784 domain-containing protein n=1 Tax=Silanimonas sp. TaxID=1929290 RepID=UPI0037C8B504